MRKSLLVLVAIFLMATSAYAWVETAENGPQNITTCWIEGVGTCTSGNVVILQVTSPTYPGKEVTFTTTANLKIYGVVVDGTDYDANDLDSGKFIRVMTHGYTDNMLVAGNIAITVGDAIGTSTTRGLATQLADTQVTGGTVALEAGPSIARQQLSVFLGN